MDESFLPFSKIIEKLTTIQGEFTDEENGTHSYITDIEIDSPVELDVFFDKDGKLKIGTVPPLYYVDTTFRPSYHQIKFHAQKID